MVAECNFLTTVISLSRESFFHFPKQNVDVVMCDIEQIKTNNF